MMPNFIEWAIKLLAVAGGAAIVGFGLGFAVRWLGRRFRVRDLPRPVLFAFRLLGGVIGGWGVWLMVSAPGGSGLVGGGGSLFGEKGSGPNNGSARVSPADTKLAAPSKPSPELQEPMRIVMLGGMRVVDARYYLLTGEKTARDLADLKKVIRARQQNGMKRLEILIYDNSVAIDHSAVLDLERWAQEHDLAVSKPPTKGEIP